MNLKWSFVILSLLVSINGLSESELDSFVKLTALGYEDACTKAAEAKWLFIKECNNASRRTWEETLVEYAEYVRTQKTEIPGMINGTLENSQLQYKLDLISKPGDASMEPEDWQYFVSFLGAAELSKIIGNESMPDRSLRQRTETLLSRNSSADEKFEIWTSWYENFKPSISHFAESLKLVENATAANDMESIDKYWLMLNDYEKSYEEAERLWEDVSRLHRRILEFLQKRLTKKYSNTSRINETLPAHLLGSLEGYDWTQLALQTIPYPDITFEIREKLLKRDLLGKNLYKAASRLGKILLKHVPETPFWEESDFTAQCPSRLIDLCTGTMRLSTCSDQSSISSYLSAHKDVARALIHQMWIENIPILNVANRYSALDSAMEELFGVLSMSRAWLLSLNLVNETDDQDEVRVVSLMMTALDVLPRMAYYLGADLWRLHVIQNKSLTPGELTVAWWEYREKYEGISTVDTSVPTFLDDEFIISNKPYLSKFLGILLGFQIYENIMDSTEMRYEKVQAFGQKHELIKMIQYGSEDNWRETIKKYLNIYEISSDSLLKYFSPLEEFLDEFDDESMDFNPSALEKAIEELEDDKKKIAVSYRSKEMTTLPTTASTSTSKDGESSKSQTTSSELKTSPHQSSSTRENTTKTVKEGHSVEKKNPQENEEVIKSGTSKAVWAVGAVLIATVTIVIIAIFGRQRCRKTPKNRRYV
ncbi:angiotensin-converting enzyme-like isoform X2 [Fopius arisanus]|nr:PREDICTED: angiotensin-converting enzyme-like isoform X2 [Fopius arisanus]XP_011300358.1 PREDICTED: angiotensin-converting enzyme-like isoform X2 [Fopius arisanus]XP_011300359.1 PREDICTED: angiotensin-converting enzyme-like isoform X2 [Fopius arisanus]XP_011300361.1 PREDICTED: angiotensin-converting enzyme-like isoform X2 [Fopius arisanus]XP_011300362.1 PREDICTED: angiotensin-converting enzyme-like isoform X2 [Fopius arisanus]